MSKRSSNKAPQHHRKHPSTARATGRPQRANLDPCGPTALGFTRADFPPTTRADMEERGWTDYRLAKEANLSHSTITNVFKRNNAPTLPTLEVICRAFGITLAQFFAEGGEAVEITDEQRELFAKWSTLTDRQKQILLDLMDSI